jgi:hypothetical protein
MALLHTEIKECVYTKRQIYIQPSTTNLHFKTATGQLFSIIINPQCTILDLKKQIYVQKDVTLDSQRLIFEGKQMDDSNRICDYPFKSTSVIHIILRLRGGMFHKSSSRADWVSLNYENKMERGLSMLHYMKNGAEDKLQRIYEEFEEMLTTTRDDVEIDMVFDLIRTIYID